MTGMKLYAVLFGALALAGCGQPGSPDNASTPVARDDPAARDDGPPLPAPSTIPAHTAPQSAPPNATASDFAPPVLTPEAERGEKGARNVLLSFARAIELQQFGQAWAMLSEADRQQWSRAQFAAIFAGLNKITVAIPSGSLEGAAGSSYYTAPITITGSEQNGHPVRIEGKAVLRRVNDVDGATAAQLRWHFERVTLAWTH